MPASSRAPDKTGSKTGAASASRSSGKGSGRAGAKSGSKGSGKASGRSKKNAPVVIPLEHARWRHFGWAAFCMVLGGLLSLKLGTVGQFVGLALIALAIYRGYRFAKTLLLPAGTIEVTSSHVDLPLGLCNGKSDRVDMADIGHVFFLRRAVPWTTAGPVLIIEAAGQAYSYPRDWFESEADQRLILQKLLNHARTDETKGGSAKSKSGKNQSGKHQSGKNQPGKNQPGNSAAATKGAVESNSASESAEAKPDETAESEQKSDSDEQSTAAQAN